jgi:asparagine synthase (glutamine-hydrolysing)
MAYGLEARVPFLDRLVIEFMTAQPLHQKVTASATKRLFKRVAKRYLPKEILQRPKHGFGSPVSEWLKTDLSHLMNDLLLGSSRFLKSSLIQTKIEEHLGGKADHSRQLWALMMLELWYRGNSRRSAL